MASEEATELHAHANGAAAADDTGDSDNGDNDDDADDAEQHAHDDIPDDGASDPPPAAHGSSGSSGNVAASAESEEDDSGAPQEGDILEPGEHLVEIVTATPCRREVIHAGLARMGWEAVRPDQSRAREESFAVREHRFIGRLTRPIVLHQSERILWEYVRRVAVDVAKDVKDYRLSLNPFELKNGTLYETLFVARMRTQPNRAAVEEHLEEMGFHPHKLSAIVRDARLTGRQNASVTVWYGLLEWDGPDSFVTDEDPFYIEELQAV